MAEGSKTPLIMIRRGPWKFIWGQDDICMLFHLASDADELHNLAADPLHQATLQAFLAETHTRWNLDALHQQVLASQRRRRLVYRALAERVASRHRDHQPFVDASRRYMRNHIDLDDLERRAPFPGALTGKALMTAPKSAQGILHAVLPRLGKPVLKLQLRCTVRRAVPTHVWTGKNLQMGQRQ